jgi:hypothetical protein
LASLPVRAGDKIIFTRSTDDLKAPDLEHPDKDQGPAFTTSLNNLQPGGDDDGIMMVSPASATVLPGKRKGLDGNFTSQPDPLRSPFDRNTSLSDANDPQNEETDSSKTQDGKVWDSEKGGWVTKSSANSSRNSDSLDSPYHSSSPSLDSLDPTSKRSRMDDYGFGANGDKSKFGRSGDPYSSKPSEAQKSSLADAVRRYTSVYSGSSDPYSSQNLYGLSPPESSSASTPAAPLFSSSDFTAPGAGSPAFNSPFDPSSLSTRASGKNDAQGGMASDMPSMSSLSPVSQPAAVAAKPYTPPPVNAGSVDKHPSVLAFPKNPMNPF